LALPFFAATLFVSAFLLFLVQPMIGKLILPKLGGTPQVWNTCMLFFQMALLAGYAYTHTATTRLPLRRQLLVHSILLFVPLIVLFAMGQPFNVAGFEAPPGANPILYTLLYLTLIVGLPFFVVATSAPLLQRWFGITGHPAAKDPYFLYAASNLGSLLSLPAYLIIIEPYISLSTQTWIWAVGYILLIGLVVGCAVMAWRAPPSVTLAGTGSAAIEMPPAELPLPPPEVATAVKPAPAHGIQRGAGRKKGKGPHRPAARAEADRAKPEPVGASRPDVVTFARRLRWILLAFVPSSLMLGVISFVSTDLSPFPLLWVAPLALYLLSFVLVFSRWPVPWTGTPHTVTLWLLPLAILALTFISLGGEFRPILTTVLAFLAFFGVALGCHGELARDRPAPQHLTAFYLCMSFGGMLGGLFNGLLAPLLFNGVAEFPLAIVLAAVVVPLRPQGGWFDNFLAETFPGFAQGVKDKGDQLAKSFGHAPPRSLYLLSFALDVLFGLFILALAAFLKARALDTDDAGWRWAWGHIYYRHSMEHYELNPLFRRWRDIGFGPDSAANLTRGLFNAIVFGVPLLFVFFFAHRPLRFAIGVGAFLLAGHLVGRDENVLYAGRSYFGVLRVFEHEERYRDGDKVKRRFYTSMRHGTTLHGQNYFEPENLKRLATTYYHRLGPLGLAMERYNWFWGDQITTDTFWADNRMPAALVGLAATPLGTGPLPLDAIIHTRSEPPYAVVGLGTGTMASYGRPFQHVTYYEIDQKVRNFSLPPNERITRNGSPFFTYVKNALDRGVNLEIIMGDARQTMEKEILPPPEEQQAPGNRYPHREKYYKVMVIDAFSSDAIPVHLLTFESVKLYSDKLAPDGVLCIHTSNRHLDLDRVVVDIADKLRMKYRVTSDSDVGAVGHSGSSYVLLAFDQKHLRFDIKAGSPSKVYATTEVSGYPNLGDGMKKWDERRRGPEYRPTGQFLWTDDYSNIWSVIR
jgi:hypothetical protein